MVAVDVNSKEEIGRLFVLHKQELHRYACRLTQGNDALAEDLIGESLRKALATQVEWTEKDKFMPWITTIARNTLFDWRKRRKIVQHAPLDVSMPAEEVVDLEATRKVRAIQAAARTLQPKYRKVLWLYCVENLTHCEIAHKLGIAPGTSQSRLFRARQLIAPYYESLELAA